MQRPPKMTIRIVDYDVEISSIDANLASFLVRGEAPKDALWARANGHWP